MPDWPLAPSGYFPGGGWRPLRKIKPPYLRGWDVFDLQCKLAYLDHEIDVDGIYGPATEIEVKGFQAYVEPAAGPVDGIAGARTQTTLGAEAAIAGELPERVRGQMEKESSLLCGIYTPRYVNGSQDRGPLQMNSQYHGDNVLAFDVRHAIPVLVSRIRANHKKYVSWGTKDERAWAAAQGHWNSPVYADRYARGDNVPDSFLDYVRAVTIYA